MIKKLKSLFASKPQISPIMQQIDRKERIKKLAKELARFESMPIAERLDDGSLKPLKIKHSDFMELFSIAKAQKELLK